MIFSYKVRANDHEISEGGPHFCMPLCIIEETLTGELIVFAGDLEAHAAGAAAVQTAQLERGACVWEGLMGGKNHSSPSAPPWDHLQEPHTAQQVHLKPP